MRMVLMDVLLGIIQPHSHLNILCKYVLLVNEVCSHRGIVTLKKMSYTHSDCKAENLNRMNLKYDVMS